MSGQSLMVELSQKQNLLEKALSELKKRGIEYATAEKEYRKGVTKRYILELDRGTPVTAIRDISRGDDEIAELKFKRDVADSTYKSAQEAINVYKLAVRLISNQIEREWNRSGN